MVGFTHLPFAIYGAVRGVDIILRKQVPINDDGEASSTTTSSSTSKKTTKLAFFKARLVDYSLALTGIWILVVYSFMAHKEFRFIYPILPIIMVYSGVAIHSLGTASVEELELEDEERRRMEKEETKPSSESAITKTAAAAASAASAVSSSRKRRKRLVYYCLAFLSLTNAVVGYYLGMFHQRGVMDVMYWLRRQVRRGAIDNTGFGSSVSFQETFPWLSGILGASKMLSPTSFMNKDEDRSMVGVDGILFLMPCHSTPFQCILHKADIPMRFITCEPPIR